MSETSFETAGFFEFNLTTGAVHAKDGQRVLILSDNVLGPLVSAAVQNQDLTAIRRLGRQLGEHVSQSLDGNAVQTDAVDVFERAGTLLSLFGWGQLAIDQWGDALVAKLANLPNLDDDDLAIAALLGGLFSALVGRAVACVPVNQTGAFLIVNPNIAERAWKWSRNGDDIPTIVSRLAPTEDA